MMHSLISLGEACLAGLRGVGGVILLFVDVLRWFSRRLPDRRVLVTQMHIIGVQSLPVILTTGAFTGMVLAYSAFYQFQELGVTSWTGPLVSESLITQLGPVLAGLMLAGRVGCAMTAELGTMAVTEQVDALRCMGTDPVQYLVLPRVLTATIMSPLLTGFATAIGIAAGLMLTVYGLGAEGHFLWEKIKEFTVPYDFFQGLVKAAFFGASIALICCYKGLNTRGGAEGVGTATTEANVASCITVLVSNLFLTMLLMVWED